MYPLMVVISELKMEASRREIPLRIRYVGSAGDRYRSILTEDGIEVRRILGSKLRRYFSLANFIDAPKFLVSIFQALWRLYWFMPDVVFSKGGSGSISVVLAARFYRIPVVIHETDSIPSLTGRITSRFAKVIAVSFKSTSEYFAKGRGEVVLTGNPVRRILLEKPISQDNAKSYFGLNSELPFILILGGSQGAVSINDFVLDNLHKLLEITQILHQVGEKNYSSFIKEYSIIEKELPNELKNRYKAVGNFDENLRIALAAADIIVSRAGGGIFEIAAFRKPSILVPLVGSAGEHQRKNAIEYAKTGAAIVFEQNNLLPNLFIKTLRELFGRSEERRVGKECRSRWSPYH